MKQNRGTRNRGEKASHVKSTDAQAAVILRLALAGEKNRALAAEFGINESTVASWCAGGVGSA